LVLLYVGKLLVFWLWRRKIDPDNSAIPFLTALGDLLGTSLLALAFHLLYISGHLDSDIAHKGRAGHYTDTSIAG
jgi:solute carrier family 41